MNLYPATAFIRHLFTARCATGHGVHSPYVFDFLNDVIRGKNNPGIITEVEKLRQEMLSDRRTVRVTDLGAGSARGSGEERRISDIASAAALPPKQVGLLARIAKSSGRTRREATQSRAPGEPTRSEATQSRAPGEPTRSEATQSRGSGRAQGSELTRSEQKQSRESGRAQAAGRSAYKAQSDAVPQMREGAEQPSDNSIILELGTSLGISTLALALAAPESRVVTVEGCPALAGIARNNLLKHGALNAEVINMEFSAALEMLSTGGTTVSLAFIDGNHRGGALTHYAETIRSMGEEMLIVADDIHLNREMYRAWSSLATSGTGERPRRAKSPQAVRLPAAPADIATASMETFRFGILFCIRNLTPGQYRIRY
jgi:predicted O-methyltransferase YrrM